MDTLSKYFPDGSHSQGGYGFAIADVFQRTQGIGVLSIKSKDEIVWDFFIYKEQKRNGTSQAGVYDYMMGLISNTEKYVDTLMGLDQEQLENFKSLADSIYNTYIVICQKIGIKPGVYSNDKTRTNRHLAKEIYHCYDDTNSIDLYEKYTRADPAVDLKKRGQLIDTMLGREFCGQYIARMFSLDGKKELKDKVDDFLQLQEVNKNEGGMPTHSYDLVKIGGIIRSGFIDVQDCDSIATTEGLGKEYKHF